MDIAADMHLHDHDRAPRRAKRSPDTERHPDDGRALQALAAGHRSAVDKSVVARIQRAAGNTGTGALLGDEERSPVHDVVGRGGGERLDAATRAFMEPRLGADLGDVRVHTDAKASQSAVSVQAHAYTVGNDVVFQSGKYDPGSDSGKRMLAHELTHVVQQRNGPVDGTPAAGGISVSDPSDRFEQEAERTADRVVSASAPVSSAPQPAAASGSVQRDVEDADVQTYAVQRQDEDLDEDRDDEQER